MQSMTDLGNFSEVIRSIERFQNGVYCRSEEQRPNTFKCPQTHASGGVSRFAVWLNLDTGPHIYTPSLLTGKSYLILYDKDN